MSLAVVATAVAVNVASNAISSKIAGDPEMPAQIGSGTSPSLSPGPEMEIAPVQGSQVQEFGDFQFENLAAPEDGQQEMILSQLQEAGVDVADLDQYGIAGMAVGGYLNRSNGGNINLGIGNLTGEDDLLKVLQEANLVSADLPEMTSDVIDVDFSEIEIPKPEDALEEQMFADLSPDIDIAAPETPEAMTRMEEAEAWINSQDPMVSDAMYKGLGNIGTALFQRLLGGDDKPKGSLVRTETLPGNSNRRRSKLKMNPIGGSSVTFANEGKVLQRPMFMPHGGAMHGPGGPKDDLIPVMASNGEYMLSKAAVDAAGDGSHAMGIARLNAFNKAGNKRYG